MVIEGLHDSEVAVEADTAEVQGRHLARSRWLKLVANMD